MMILEILIATHAHYQERAPSLRALIHGWPRSACRSCPQNAFNTRYAAFLSFLVFSGSATRFLQPIWSRYHSRRNFGFCKHFMVALSFARISRGCAVGPRSADRCPAVPCHGFRGASSTRNNPNAQTPIGLGLAAPQNGSGIVTLESTHFIAGRATTSCTWESM
jgi:hypothetical protein